MYNLSKEQKADFQNFLNKVEGTMVGGNLKKWFDEVEPTERVTSEQLEKLLSFQNGLPKELQSYPQSFAAWLKNGGDSHEVAGSINHLEDKSSSAEVVRSKGDTPLLKTREKKVVIEKVTNKKKK